MSCSQHKSGNLFGNNLPKDGPFEGKVERTCQSDNSFSQTSSSFFSTQMPQEPQKVRNQLERSVNTEGGILNGMANMFKSVFAPPVKNQKQSPTQQGQLERSSYERRSERTPNDRPFRFDIQQQEWPSPPIGEVPDEDDLNNQNTLGSMKGGNKHVTTSPQKPKRRSGKQQAPTKTKKRSSIKKSITKRKSSQKRATVPSSRKRNTK